MKKALKIVAVGLAVAFLAIQLIRPDFTNPPVNQAEALAASASVPANVEAIFKRSCADCHSHETRYPWYSYVQPSAWFLAGHIADGRAELNFSVWNTYPASRKKRKLEEICDQVRSREMPLPSYLWIHGAARLTDDDVKTLCDWTEAESARLAGE